MTTLTSPSVKPFPTFGRWLLRAQADLPGKMTWKQLAEHSGLSYSYLIQLKNGHERPTPKAIARLEAILGIPYPGDVPLSHVDAPTGSRALPIFRAIAAPPWLVPTGDLESVHASEFPGPDGFFVIQSDAGLMPSIPAGALCLTDPQQRHVPSAPTPMLVQLTGQAPTGRLIWRSPRGVHVVAGQGVSGNQQHRDTPVQDGQTIEVLGRLLAVRFRL